MSVFAPLANLVEPLLQEVGSTQGALPAPVSNSAQAERAEQARAQRAESEEASKQVNPYASQMLRAGSVGPGVKYLQGALNTTGASLDVDGAFGMLTHGAVVAFQRSAGLSVDGVVGPQTWGALDSGAGTAKTEQPPDTDKTEQPPDTAKTEQPPDTDKTEQPPAIDTSEFDGVYAKLVDPNLQGSSLGPLLRRLAAAMGLGPGPVDTVFAVEEAQSDSGDAFSADKQQAEQKRAVASVVEALSQQATEQYPADSQHYAGPPDTVNGGYDRLFARGQKPLTAAEEKWLYQWMKVAALWEAMIFWDVATKAGTKLHPMRASIVSLALGQPGTVEAALPSGETREVAGKQIPLRRGADRFMEILAAAGPQYVQTDKQKQDVMDARVPIGKPLQLVPSWCGIFALWLQNMAGNGGGTWPGAWAGPSIGPEKHQFRNPNEAPRPGDIAWMVADSHHGTVIAVNGDQVITIEGNTGTMSGITLRSRARTEWKGFVRAISKTDEAAEDAG